MGRVSYGLGPYAPPWALMGMTLMGQTLMGLPGPFWAGPLWVGPYGHPWALMRRALVAPGRSYMYI